MKGFLDRGKILPSSSKSSIVLFKKVAFTFWKSPSIKKPSQSRSLKWPVKTLSKYSLLPTAPGKTTSGSKIYTFIFTLLPQPIPHPLLQIYHRTFYSRPQITDSYPQKPSLPTPTTTTKITQTPKTGRTSLFFREFGTFYHLTPTNPKIPSQSSTWLLI